MLSYQHIYHAGNLADVQKHALLCAMLEYMRQKPKPMSYLETHSGRALYDLSSAEATKTGEAEAGIGLAEKWFAAEHPFRRALKAVRDGFGEQSYGGSPLLAAQLLRPDDKMHLAELHPQEGDALEDAMVMFDAKIHRRDGFEMAQAVCPPTPRRGMLLIDPSYEIKTDYETIPKQIAKLHRKWNVGVIALWYPILADGTHLPMVTALEFQNLPKVLRHEVRFPAAREGHRMIGSGMFIVNAPYGLDDEAKRLTELFGKA
ncbi:23S rRNA (adenine(2030)-N(6))-methyltransferase RlmJ [Cognatishimia activa]|uniref:Ribosomal RNA large subunit methyltransferase J n=1 Tax=Cognatishimia activa TaxID=1715691 RepID=A0A0P1IRH2_9RHOB|nr:23S rRNA (adenine(2030)-N(6))-methyltransferase RlmJ [Cognatishimia activa]CUJ01167.1 Ribosomal RNA large subunit methyltransferase J [Cognatishimia activa]CUK26182.1 Ribosomal RNA large subunit methyltransferase J [Cognatishimia activa]